MVALAAHYAYSGPQANEAVYKKLRLIAEATDIIDKFYVETVDMDKVFSAALSGMMSALDPHSVYLSPADNKEFTIQMKGAFGGIGIVIGAKEGSLVVVSPLEDTPAFREGLKAGDKIIAIDGNNTQGWTIEEAVNKMRGPEGTQVVVEVRRGKEETTRKFTLRRATIKIPNLRSKLFDRGIGYIRLIAFREGVAAEIHNELEKLQKAAGGQLHGLILDLRYNPGGLLNEGVEVADVFLKSGIIVYTEGRSPQSKMLFLANDNNNEPQCPIIVLINEGSASASEIVAGALRDHQKALLLGVRSFGKGSVQTKFELSDRSSIQITTAKYYTPNGTCIQAQGIEPDITVKFVPLEKTEEQPRREQDIEGHIKAKTETKETPGREEEDDLQKDNQLKTALDLLRSRALLSQWQ